MPVIADKFGRASIPTDTAIATTVKTTRAAGVLVLETFDLSKFTTDTPVFFVTYKKTTDPVTGVVSITNLVSYKALVNTGANTLTNLTVAPGYTDLGNAVGDFVECIPTSFWENSLIDGIFVGHNPDGTFKVSAVNTALQGILDAGLNATLANQLAYTNLLINGGCMVAQRGVPNLSTTYQYGKVDRFAAKATGTAVSAGTITQITSSLLAATKGYDLKIAGVTVTGTGIVFLRYRVEAKDAVNFVNGIGSFSCRVYHNVGSSVNYTIYINKPTTTADDFSALTAVANSGAISVPNATATLLKFENINAGNLGDVSKGLEIEIQIACGAVTTKDFNFAEFMFNKGAVAGGFQLKRFDHEFRDCLRYFEKSYQYGTAPGTNVGEDYTQMSVARVIVGSPYRQKIDFRAVKVKTPTVVNYSAQGVTGQVCYGTAGASFGASGTAAFNPNTAATCSPEGVLVGSTGNYSPDNLGAACWTADAEL